MKGKKISKNPKHKLKCSQSILFTLYYDVSQTKHPVKISEGGMLSALIWIDKISRKERSPSITAKIFEGEEKVIYIVEEGVLQFGPPT